MNDQLRITNEKEEHPILAQKLSASVQIPKIETEHTLDNLTPSSKPNAVPKIDPYREIPE
ncbi:hypothetical protein HYZ82_02075 [Candidatus Nomurabacteria bacterium]|nr:hypothetical protein [Candidatus Nomurabacteria bacterium]